MSGMFREALGRRGLFKRLGVGALLIGASPQEIAKLAGVGPSMVLPALTGTASLGKAVNAARVFTTASEFSTWWKEFGKRSAYEQAAYSRDLDPDIAGFHLPLGTKLRMQRDRNYSRIKDRMRANFLQTILRGPYHEWGHNSPTAGYSGGTAQRQNY